jgi:drug/metabolite transporter (DMT)-like permease
VSLVWIPVVLIAAFAQTLRNATQTGLTASIGAAGATQVRFLYGLPFGIAILALASLLAGRWPPMPDAGAIGFILLGAMAQIAATALMLVAMRDRGFGFATALIKTEPMIVAVLGFVVLGDGLSILMILGIGLASIGVIAMGGRRRHDRGGALRPIVMGLAAAGLFGLAAIGFRGAILRLGEVEPWLAAATILALALAIQSALLGAFLVWRDRAALSGSLVVWRQSLFAGFLGALASQFWFLGFALTSAANVRTLALVEVLFALAIGRKRFAEAIGPRQAFGIAALLAGVALVVAAAH